MCQNQNIKAGIFFLIAGKDVGSITAKIDNCHYLINKYEKIGK